MRTRRQEIAYATPLARYGVYQVRAGRKPGITLNVRDVSSGYAQRAKRFQVERLDRYDSREGEWREFVVEDRRAGPAETAAARIDLAAWLDSLPGRDRKIAEVLARGERTSEAARRFGLSCGRVSQLRRELAESWQAFHAGPARQQA